MALARIRTEWVKAATFVGGVMSVWCGAQPFIQGPGCGRTVCSGAVHTVDGRGRVHKSVSGSLLPRKITFPL